MSTSIATFAPRARFSLPVLGASSGATLFAGLALLLGAAAIGQAISPRQAALYLLGGALGLVLYHAAFGFTSAWRVFIADRRGAGLRAQMVMLALATALFFPVLAAGSLFGQPVQGIVSPVGISVVVGAFIFGIGMQLGGGCASGTLYTVGGGSTRMLITLAAFIVGSTLGRGALPLVGRRCRASRRISLVKLWGPWTGARRSASTCSPPSRPSPSCSSGGATASLEADKPTPRQGLARFAARSLAARRRRGRARARCNFATLALAGRPWGITSAFALWGSKIADGDRHRRPGAGPTGRRRRGWPSSRAACFNDVTSVMDFGIIVGALLAAGLAGRFAPAWRVPLRSAAAAVVGGLLLGYGARLAYGCNIGAYFSGIASGSLHGWVWLVAAFAGNVIGT